MQSNTASSEQILQMQSQIRRLRQICGLLLVSGLILATWTYSNLTGTQKIVRAERLEILEATGEPSLVLANSQRPVMPTLDGEPFGEGHLEKRRGSPSIIFFDGHGDEVGGMLFHNSKSEDGATAVRHLSLDGYKNDQSVLLRHIQTPQGSYSGLSVSDTPPISSVDSFAKLNLKISASEEEFEAAMKNFSKEERSQRMRELFGANRVFVGLRNGDALLELRDDQERPRFVVRVPPKGTPTMQLLDENGQVQTKPETPPL